MTFRRPLGADIATGNPQPRATTSLATAFASIRLDTVTPQRWRNGRGWTRELIASPAGADWRVRVSVAEIEADGPFSVFADVQRWFCVLAGGGVELTIDGRTLRLEVGDAPVRFAGCAVTECRLIEGPTRDLNLMVRDGPGSMTAVSPGCAWTPPPGPCGLYAAVDGVCNGLPVAAHSLLWFDGVPARLVFDCGGATQRPAAWWLATMRREASA